MVVRTGAPDMCAILTEKLIEGRLGGQKMLVAYRFDRELTERPGERSGRAGIAVLPT